MVLTWHLVISFCALLYLGTKSARKQKFLAVFCPLFYDDVTSGSSAATTNLLGCSERASHQTHVSLRDMSISDCF
jgi:hypothetical protein